MKICLPLVRPIELPDQLCKQLHITDSAHIYSAHTRVICHHQACDTVCTREKGTRSRQSHLNARWTPRHEVLHILLSYPLQALVDFHRVDRALDDVQNRDKPSRSRVDAHHEILVLQQTTHHIVHTRLANSQRRVIDGKRSV